MFGLQAWKGTIILLCSLGLGILGCSSTYSTPQVQATPTPMSLVRPIPCAAQDAENHNGKIAFSIFPGGGETAIYLVEPNGCNLTRILSEWSKVLWSPDGKRLTFADDVPVFHNKFQNDVHVFVMNSDGSELRDLTPEHNVDLASALAWSPDSRWIAFQHHYTGSDRPRVQQIALVNVEGGSVEILDLGFMDYFSLSWLPDGQHLVFYSNEPLQPERNGIFRATTDGTGLVHLNKEGFHPRPSPDGTRIAFQVRNGKQADLYLTDASGADPRRLTEGMEIDDFAWSPDGSRIVFQIDLQIYILDVETSSITRLDDGFIGNQPWSPDGNQITYECQIGNRPGVCIIHADGTGRTQLVEIISDDTPLGFLFPAWQPVP